MAQQGVTIPRELYDFLMGTGPIEGVWFGEMNSALPGAFWWRALLRPFAPAQGIETAVADETAERAQPVG